MPGAGREVLRYTANNNTGDATYDARTPIRPCGRTSRCGRHMPHPLSSHEAPHGVAMKIWTALFLALCAGQAAHAQDIVIGQSVPLSGSNADIGRDMRDGALAVFARAKTRDGKKPNGARGS